AVASRLGRSPKDIPEECPPEYQQHWLAGFNGEDEKAWTEAEQHEAQREAAKDIPVEPNNVGKIAAALKAKPGKKPGTVDPASLEGDSDTPQGDSAKVLN